MSEWFVATKILGVCLRVHVLKHCRSPPVLVTLFSESWREGRSRSLEQGDISIVAGGNGGKQNVAASLPFSFFTVLVLVCLCEIL